MSTPALVYTADGTAQLTLASAYTANSGSFTLSASPGFTASASAPLAITLITRSTYGTGASEVSTTYYITGVSGAVCTIGGVLSGSDQDFAAGDYAESRVCSAVVNGPSDILDFSASTGGYVLTSNGTSSPPTWQAGGSGSGTVTSVAMTVPSWLSVSGSPVTSSGTLAVSAAGSQTANRVLATPNGSSGAASLRALVAADLPSIQNFPAATDSAPSAGDLWVPTSGGGLSFTRAVDGSSNRLTAIHGGVFYSGRGYSAVASTTSATSLLQSPGSSAGSLTIPAGVLQERNEIRLWPVMRWSSNGSGYSLSLAVKLGSTTVLQSVASGTLGASATNQVMVVTSPLRIFFNTVGSSGTCTGSGLIAAVPSTGTGVANFFFAPSSGGGQSAVTINTTVANTIDFQATPGASDPSNAVQVLGFLAEIVN